MGTCTVEDCTRDARRRGWCDMHYQRWHKTGSTFRPERTSKPSGQARLRASRAYASRLAAAPTDGLVNRDTLRARQGSRCFYCGVEMNPYIDKWAPSSTDETIDHVHPLSMGGHDSLSNCVLACRACNGRKGDRTLAQWGWPFSS